jgi:hypothetical protein
MAIHPAPGGHFYRGASPGDRRKSRCLRGDRESLLGRANLFLTQWAKMGDEQLEILRRMGLRQ